MGGGVSEGHVISVQHHSETVGLQESDIDMLGSSHSQALTVAGQSRTGKSDLMSLLALKSLRKW